jgi:predicted nucleotidyltransferase
MKHFDGSQKAELHPVAMVLREVKHQADLAGVQIMVVGATARDILIRQVIGSPPERATADIDVAVAVSSWAEVHNLTQAMQSAGVAHKFRVQGTEVDIIPFGEIESDERTITWSNEHLMDVFGFREAWADTVSVRLPFETEVAVASLPAQSLLKILAWRDRRSNDTRDAIDLRSILRSYHEGPYLEELYEGFGNLLEKNDFVPEYAGAERMGQEARQLIAASDRGVVLDVLRDVRLVERLSEDMRGMVSESHALISAYARGFD